MSKQVIPEGVDIDSLDLSVEEMKAYPRWYTDLLLRKGKQTVVVGDVLSFLDNFGVRDGDKQLILTMFAQPLVTLDPAQFYIFLRLASHILEGVPELTPGMGFMCAPVPRPRSILSRKRKMVAGASNPPSPSPILQQSVGNPFRRQQLEPSPSPSPKKMDIDMFKTFILTGNRPASDDEMAKSPPKRKKRVTFDNRPPEVAEAAARSMDELLRQCGTAKAYVAPELPTFFDYSSFREDPTVNSNNMASTGINGNNHPHIVVGNEEEDEDVEIDNNAFKNVSIDSVLHHGVSIRETDFNHFGNDSPSPGISPSPSPDLRPQQVQQRTGGFPSRPPPPPPPPPPPRSRLGSAEGRASPDSSLTSSNLGVTMASVPSIPSPLNPAATGNQSTASISQTFLSPQYRIGSSPFATNGQMAPTPTGFQSPQPSHFLSQPQLTQSQPMFLRQEQEQQQFQSGLGIFGPPTQTFAQSVTASPPIGQPNPICSYQRPVPPLSLRHNAGSPGLLAPPPPQPRRATTGSSVLNPMTTDSRQFNGPPLPPPPPPTRRRAPSLPPHPSGMYSPNPMTNLNLAATSSEPNLLGDLRDLQEEVNRLSGL